MIEKLKKVFNEPLQLTFMAAGLGLFAYYCFYVRKNIGLKNSKIQEKNMLKMSMSQLIKTQDNANICKIVITESSPTSSQFKGKVVTRLKQFLKQQQLQVLINCSPLKLFRDSAQTFISTLTQEDAQDQKDLMAYFQSALRCQLIIQRTIVDLQKIRNNNNKTYIICDTNSLDIKVNSNLQMWQKFIKLHKINQNDLKKNYNIIFHIKGALSQTHSFLDKGYSDYFTMKKDFDLKTTNTWKNSLNYHIIYYEQYLMMEQNVQIALEHIIDCLRPFFDKQIIYRKRLVFAKDW